MKLKKIYKNITKIFIAFLILFSIGSMSEAEATTRKSLGAAVNYYIVPSNSTTRNYYNNNKYCYSHYYYNYYCKPSYTKRAGYITVRKYWAGDRLAYGEQRPDVYFQLYKNGEKVGSPKKAHSNRVKYKIADYREIPQYSVEEVNADGTPWSAPGYEAGPTSRVSMVDKCNGVVNVTNMKRSQPVPGKIYVCKSWKGAGLRYGESRPDVYFELYKDGESTGVRKKLDPRTNIVEFIVDNYKEMNRYTVKEVNEDGSPWTADGYEQGSISGLHFKNPCVAYFYASNTKTPQPTPGKIYVCKSWKGEPLRYGESRPEVYFELYKDGVSTGVRKKLNLRTNIVEFTVDNYKEMNRYTVKEVNEDGSPWTADGYEQGSISGLHFKNPCVAYFYASNTKTPQPTPGKIYVCKSWKGEPLRYGESRPEVYFELYKDGVSTGVRKKLNLRTNIVEFTVDNYKEMNRYTVKEVNEDGSPWTADGYEQGRISGLHFKNPCVAYFYASNVKKPKGEPGKIYAYKNWEGENLDYGEEYPDVYFQLYKDGNPVGGPVKLENDWVIFNIDNIDEIDRYTIEEVNADGSPWTHEGYRRGDITRKDDGKDGKAIFEAINYKEKPKIYPGEISVDKTWTGDALPEGQEHPDVYFQLLKNGVKVGDPVHYMGERVIFTIDNIKEIDQYTVVEINEDGTPWSAPGYEAGEIVGENGHFTISNRRINPEPIRVPIEVKKIFNGYENITDDLFLFELLDEDGNVLQTAWNKNKTVKFEDLEFNQAGEYIYYIKEVDREEPGIIYDKKTIKVQIDIDLEDDNKLTYTVSYEPSDQFENGEEKQE